MQAEHKVQRDRMKHATWPMTDDERDAHAALEAAVIETPSIMYTVTGPLIKNEGSFTLEVREFGKVV